jgi:gliding motility-associated-like protein
LGNADYDRLSLPNVFTPNGDGLNEAFVLPGEYWGCIERVMIFDRWGNRVFESRDLKVSWDGRYKGEPVPEGVFVVVIEIGGIQYVGTVTVLR